MNTIQNYAKNLSNASKIRNKIINDDFYPTSISQVNDIDDILIDNQFSQLTTKKTDPKYFIQNDDFNVEFTTIMNKRKGNKSQKGEFIFLDNSREMKNLKSHNFKQKKDYKEKEIQAVNGNIIEFRKNFFTSFPNQIKYFDNSKANKCNQLCLLKLAIPHTELKLAPKNSSKSVKELIAASKL